MNLMHRPSLAEWQAEHCRLTVFPTPDITVEPSQLWWQAVAQNTPDETTSNPKKGFQLIQGAFEESKLVLKLESNRVDWVLGPKDPSPSEAPVFSEFQTIGEASSALAKFSDLSERWLARNDVPPIGRIALGAVLLHVEADRREGYRRLSEYVPVRIDPESTDFLYQINLPPIGSSTGINGLRLNRLSRWTVAAFKIFRLMGTAMSERPGSQCALRVELDINTAPEFQGPIPHDQLIHVYRELAAKARDIVTNGVA